MASPSADSLSWAIYDLVEEMTSESIYKAPSAARLGLAVAIDELLKNLLLAPVDQYTIK